MKDRIKILYIPYLLTLIGLIIGYTFLHWLLFIKIDIFPTKEVVTNFGVPIALTALVSFIIFWPKLKVLDIENDKRDWTTFYSLFLWISLTIPLIISQEYIITATGKLTELNSINEINKNNLTKYYSFKHYYIDKKVIGVHSEFEVSGKRNQYLDMHLYIAMPIFNEAKDTIDKKPFAWLGISYYKRISNNLEPKEKELKYKGFVNKSLAKFNKKNVSNFIYLDRIGHSDKKKGFVEAIKANPIYEPNEIIFEAINKPFKDRNGKKLEWIIGTSIFGSIIWLLMIFIPKINQKELKRIKSGKSNKDTLKELNELINFLKPKEGFFITPILMFINIGFFVIMFIAGYGFISFNGKDLLYWGANYGPLTKNGEWWRLIINMFLHGGFFHLFYNMIGLVFVGLFLEPILGKTKYLAVYILTGIFASITSIWWHNSTISVGASGAIFGLYGILIVLLLTKPFPVNLPKSFIISIVIFVGINLLMGFSGGIDNAAHIGGLISGLTFGLILTPILKKENNNEK